LHHDLLRYYPRAANFAGGYKKTPNRVIFINHKTGEQGVVLDPAAPGMITNIAMAGLVNWYNLNIRENPWSLLVATEFVFRFLAIHPFQDGNGRLGRALFILTLLQSGDKYLKGITPYIAMDRHKVSDIEKDIGIPRRTVQYTLQTLTKKQFIQKLGQKAGTRYQLIF